MESRIILFIFLQFGTIKVNLCNVGHYDWKCKEGFFLCILESLILEVPMH